MWDEDRGKDDDLMGTCTIKLTDIPLEREVRQWYSIDPVNNYNTSSSRLEVSIRIKSNEKLIRIVKDQALNRHDSVESEVKDAIDSIVAEFPFARPSESVEKALKRNIDMENIHHFSAQQLRDLLCDVSSVTKKMTDADKQHYHALINSTVFNRTALRLLNSTRVVFAGRLQCARHPPIEENCIQLNLTVNESLYVLIKFPNRLSLWVGARWFQLMYDVWHRIVKPQDAPHWASSGVYSVNVSLQLSDGRSFHGTLKMSFDTKFRMFIEKEMIEIDSMSDMVLSLDSLEPSSYIMDVEVLAFSMDGEFSEQDKVILAGEKGTELSEHHHEEGIS